MQFQLGHIYHRPITGKHHYRFEPFDYSISLCDHRQPFLAAFAYLALALRCNTPLLLRPSASVLPALAQLQTIWEDSGKLNMVRCLPDEPADPKDDKSLVKHLLSSTEGFISFWGRLGEGLDFHYYMSQSSEGFRES
jgi:hypothetical protein